MKVTVETVCPFCGCVNKVTFEERDWYDWQFNAVLIQDAFPYLTADERELLISGICPDCWNGMFGEGEE